MEFRVYIEGSISLFDNIDDVVDHMKPNTYFEVDGEALRVDLRYLRPYKMVEFKVNDCWIQRTA